MSEQVGLIGLGAMGHGLALNLVDQGIGVVAWDRDISSSDDAVSAGYSEIQICASLQSLVSELEAPRCIMLSIPGGAPVDEILSILGKELSPGDVVVECGNSYFRDTNRRGNQLRENGIALLGLGISGGPGGARKGPAIMAGGDPEAWERTSSIFTSIAAKAGDTPCCQFFGDGGAGHFVKMVHNGIEYAIMHLLMETYAILEHCCGFTPDRIAAEFENLDHGTTASFLTRVTANVAGARNTDSGQFLIDLVDDAAGQKGTGQWTVQTALELGVAAPTLAEAVMWRSLSSHPLYRNNPDHSGSAPVAKHSSKNQANLLAVLPDALALTFASAFIQGLSICDAAAGVLDHDLNRETILHSWRRGCILESAMVELLLDGEKKGADHNNPFSNEAIKSIVEKGLGPLRQLVANTAQAGIPCSGFASALAYVEALNGSPLPTALIQLQRDYFGRHGLKAKQTGDPIQAPWAPTPDAKLKGHGS